MAMTYAQAIATLNEPEYASIGTQEQELCPPNISGTRRTTARSVRSISPLATNRTMNRWDMVPVPLPVILH